MTWKKGESGNPYGRVPKDWSMEVCRLRAMITEDNFNPLLELRKLAQFSDNETTRLAASKELANYIMPKLKQTDMNIDANIKGQEDWIDKLVKKETKE